MQPGVQIVVGLGTVGLGDLLPADALHLVERRELVVADLPHFDHAHLQRVGVGFDLFLGVHLQLHAGGHLARLDTPRQIDLLGGVEQRNLADLLEVHAHRVVGGRLQQVDLDAHLGGGIGLFARDLDDLDALAGEVLLDLGQELLDLFGSEVVDGDGFEEVLGGDETTFPPFGGDGLLDLVQARDLAGRHAQRISWGVGCTTPKCTEREGSATLPARTIAIDLRSCFA